MPHFAKPLRTILRCDSFQPLAAEMSCACTVHRPQTTFIKIADFKLAQKGQFVQSSPDIPYKCCMCT